MSRLTRPCNRPPSAAADLPSPLCGLAFGGQINWTLTRMTRGNVEKTITASTLEFLEWLSSQPRTYEETMEAWRTSCPRLSTWEDSTIDGLVSVVRDPRTGESTVILTDKGRSLLA